MQDSPHPNRSADFSLLEQRMIESLAEHGVLAADLVPALMTTHTVKNPEYDPAAAQTIKEEPESDEDEIQPEASPHTDPETIKSPAEPPSGMKSPMGLSHSDPFGDDDEEEAPPPPYEAPKSVAPEPTRKKSSKSVNPFGDDSDFDEGDIGSPPPTQKTVVVPAEPKPELEYPPIEEGDIANTLEDLVRGKSGPDEPLSARPLEGESISETAAEPMPPENPAKPTNAAEVVQRGVREEGPKQSEALPGVSTALSKTDENVILDIRWTVVSLMVCVTMLESPADIRLVSSYATCSYN